MRATDDEQTFGDLETLFVWRCSSTNLATTALGARVAEGEARQREIEKELAFTRTRLAGLQGDSVAYGMWRLRLDNQNPRVGDFVFLDSQMRTTHSLSETTYLQVNDIDSNGNESNFTDIRGGDIIRPRSRVI